MARTITLKCCEGAAGRALRATVRWYGYSTRDGKTGKKYLRRTTREVLTDFDDDGNVIANDTLRTTVYGFLSSLGNRVTVAPGNYEFGELVMSYEETPVDVNSPGTPPEIPGYTFSFIGIITHDAVDVTPTLRRTERTYAFNYTPDDPEAPELEAVDSGVLAGYLEEELTTEVTFDDFIQEALAAIPTGWLSGADSVPVTGGNPTSGIEVQEVIYQAEYTGVAGYPTPLVRNQGEASVALVPITRESVVTTYYQPRILDPYTTTCTKSWTGNHVAWASASLQPSLYDGGSISELAGFVAPQGCDVVAIQFSRWKHRHETARRIEYDTRVTPARATVGRPVAKDIGEIETLYPQPNFDEAVGAQSYLAVVEYIEDGAVNADGTPKRLRQIQGIGDKIGGDLPFHKGLPECKWSALCASADDQLYAPGILAGIHSELYDKFYELRRKLNNVPPPANACNFKDKAFYSYPYYDAANWLLATDV